MSNFLYLAFAFSRVSLIGKKHLKLVEYMSKIKIKKYMFVTGLISLVFSVVKGFKYKVNYEYSELNYPYIIEVDLYRKHHWTLELYLVANSIFDMVNYLLFTIINLSIDVYMLVRLRATFREKINRLESLENKNSGVLSKQTSQKITDMNDAMTNAIRMVIVNSAFNIFFKIPLLIVPVYNSIYTFYFKKNGTFFKDSMRILDYKLNYVDLIYLLTDLSDFLFTLLISIQFFVYVCFDKNIKMGFHKIFSRNLDEKQNK